MVKPFVKWPGGKGEEIDIIHSYIPNDIQNYIEPFLGGGACILSLNVDMYNKSYVNDFSHELISLYRMIKENNEVFNNYLQDIWNFWNIAGEFSREVYIVIREIYSNYKDNTLDDVQLKVQVKQFIDGRVNRLLEGLPISLQRPALQSPC